MSDSKTFTGKNVEAAVAKAAKALGVTEDQLNYDVLAGKTGGFALIRMRGEGGGDSAGASPLQESLSGVPSPEGPGDGGDDRPAPSGESRRDDRRDDRGDDRRDDRRGGGRRDDRRGGRRDDRRGGGRRDDRRGGRRDDRRGGGRGGRRGEYEMPVVPADGPTEVTMAIAEGLTLSEIGEDAHEVIRDVLVGMGFGLTVKVDEDDERILFDLHSDDYHEALVANDLELLEAVQHIVDKIVNFDSEDHKTIIVDAKGHKAQADIDLQASAHDLAQQAIDQSETMKIGPLNPRARRIVHMALQELDGVTTRSEGEGVFRRVCIVPDAE